MACCEPEKRSTQNLSTDCTECLSLLSCTVKSKVVSGTIVSRASSVCEYSEGLAGYQLS